MDRPPLRPGEAAGAHILGQKKPPQVNVQEAQARINALMENIQKAIELVEEPELKELLRGVAHPQQLIQETVLKLILTVTTLAVRQDLIVKTVDALQAELKSES